MKKKIVAACLMMCVGLAFAGCSKEDKAAEETEVQEEVVDFETQAEEVPVEEPAVMEAPVEAEVPAPVEEIPVAEEPVQVAEETPAPEEEPAPAPETQSDYSVEETGETTLYTTDTVNMRTGPSSADFEVVGKLAKNKQITATGKVNGYKGDGKVWYRVKRTDSDEPAFVAGDYVSTEKPKEEEKKAETPVATTADATATDDAAAKAAADAAAKAAADAAAKAAADEAAKAAAATPAATPAPAPAAAGGTHNLNGLVVNDAEYRALLDTWRWATNGTDEEAEHYVLKHSAGDLEAVLRSKGMR